MQLSPVAFILIALHHSHSQLAQQLPRIARQKAFEDFFAACRYLIHEKYTQKSKVVITGHANSAILAAVCLNREPGDFSTAVFTSGVFDVVRYHQLEREFWSSVDFEQMQTKEDFSALLRFSPLHTIQKYLPSQIQYPSILVLNEATDSQVSPFHSYKYAAELQNRIGNLSQQTNPLLLKVGTESLVEFEAKISSKIQQWSAAFTFMKRTTNLEFNGASGLKNLILYTVASQYVLFYST